jgi:tRNA threonylcarbamoyladenosine modification (KEOPS) complex Cgi121 subunit
LFFQLPELAAHVWISAFTTKPDDFDAALREVQKEYPDVSVQFVDLDNVPGSRYLFLATLNALKSFRSKQPISKTLSMEILLYVSTSRQIAEAIRLVGMSSDTNRIAVISVGKTKEELSGTAAVLNRMLNQKNSDALVDVWSTARIENVRSLFQIGSKELKATLRKKESRSQAVERLAIERSALLTVRK